MHKLDRTAVTEPICLALYDYSNGQKWDNLSADHKKEIREELENMQQNRCAYCEGPYYSHERHIEHFRRKNPKCFPQLTFVWTNLFLSCDAGAQDHCGHYKDRKGSPYNPDDLIKPDDDDPDNFLYFYSSGEVRPRSGTDEKRVRRANETIRVFNLNHPRLMANRRRAVKSYKEPQFMENLETLTPAEQREYLELEIEDQRSSFFVTTIRHFLQKYRIDSNAQNRAR